MKRTLILAATIASISIPGAMAQTSTNPGQSNSSQTEMNSNQSQQGTINPEHLSTQQVRQIQTALNKQGFKTGKADGKWGSETENAVKKFQQQRNLQGNGQLDEETLSALGVNIPASESTGSSSQESSSPSTSNSSKSRQ